jgi:hypothetical protein
MERSMPFSLLGEKFPGADEWKTAPIGAGLGVPQCPTTKPRNGDLTAIDNSVGALSDVSTGSDRSAQAGALRVLVSTAETWLQANPLHTFQGADKKQRVAAVEDLKARAERATLRVGMLARAIRKLITTPNDINRELLFDSSADVIGDKMWENFMTWARSEVKYVASAQFGGEDLLAGSTKAVPCGGISTALRIFFTSVLGKRVPAKGKTIPGYLITKPEFHCFDRTVTGNVRDATTKQPDGRCIFNQHFYVEYNNSRYYDPCMDATYRVQNECIQAELQKIGEGVAIPKNAKATDEIYFHTKAVNAQGFVGTWTKLKIKDVGNGSGLKALLGSDYLRLSDGDIRLAAERCAKIPG